MDCVIQPELVFERYCRGAFANNSDGTMFIFDVYANGIVTIQDMGADQRSFRCPNHSLAAIALLKNIDRHFIIDVFGSIHIFCAHTGRFCCYMEIGMKCTLPFRIKPLFSFAFSPDYATLITGGISVKIYDTKTGKLKRTIIDHPCGFNNIKHHSGFNDIYNVAYSSNGTMFASCAKKAGLQLWNAKTYQKIYEVRAIGKNNMTYVTFSPDGSLIAYFLNGYITVFNVMTYKVIYIAEHKYITSIAISSDNLKIITCSLSENTKVWNILNGQLIYTFNDGVARTATFTQNSNMIIINYESCIRMWRINKFGHRTKQALRIKETDSDKPYDLPDGDKLNDLPDGDKLNDLPDGDKLNDLPDGDKSNDLPDGDKSNDLPDGDKSNVLPDGDKLNDLPDGDKLNDLTDEGNSNDSINDKTNDLLVKSINSISNEIICHDLGKLDLNELNELNS